MNDKIIAKSERSITNTITLFMGIVLLSFLTFLINYNFQPKNEYEENLKLLGFLVLVLILLYCFYYWLNQKRIYVYENYFEIKNFLQTKKYHYREITTHFSEYFEGKYNSWTEYYLVLNTGEKITIIDTEYVNFYHFYSKIKQRVKGDKELNLKLSEQKYLKYAVICSIIASLIFYFSSFFYDFTKIKNTDFVYITNKLKNDMSLVNDGKGKKHFEFELSNQPNFVYTISGRNYEVVSNDNQFLNTFKQNNAITIGIEKDDFEKKISKTKPLNILDRYLKYSKIKVEQVRDTQKEFLINLEEVNRLKVQNNYLGIGIFSIFGLLFLYLTYGNYIAYTKSINQIKNKNHL